MQQCATSDASAASGLDRYLPGSGVEQTLGVEFGRLGACLGNSCGRAGHARRANCLARTPISFMSSLKIPAKARAAGECARMPNLCSLPARLLVHSRGPAFVVQQFLQRLFERHPTAIPQLNAQTPNRSQWCRSSFVQRARQLRAKWCTNWRGAAPTCSQRALRRATASGRQSNATCVVRAVRRRTGERAVAVAATAAAAVMDAATANCWWPSHSMSETQTNGRRQCRPRCCGLACSPAPLICFNNSAPLSRKITSLSRNYCLQVRGTNQHWLPPR